MTISSSRLFEERYLGRVFKFSAGPWVRKFSYDGAVEDEKRIQVDTLIDERERFCFFEPTPFTQWTIEIDTKAGPDLSGLSDIILDFAGSMLIDSTAGRASA